MSSSEPSEVIRLSLWYATLPVGSQESQPYNPEDGDVSQDSGDGPTSAVGTTTHGPPARNDTRTTADAQPGDESASESETDEEYVPGIDSEDDSDVSNHEGSHEDLEQVAGTTPIAMTAADEVHERAAKYFESTKVFGKIPSMLCKDAHKAYRALAERGEFTLADTSKGVNPDLSAHKLVASIRAGEFNLTTPEGVDRLRGDGHIVLNNAEAYITNMKLPKSKHLPYMRGNLTNWAKKARNELMQGASPPTLPQEPNDESAKPTATETPLPPVPTPSAPSRRRRKKRGGATGWDSADSRRRRELRRQREAAAKTERGGLSDQAATHPRRQRRTSRTDSASDSRSQRHVPLPPPPQTRRAARQTDDALVGDTDGHTSPTVTVTDAVRRTFLPKYAPPPPPPDAADVGINSSPVTVSAELDPVISKLQRLKEKDACLDREVRELKHDIDLSESTVQRLKKEKDDYSNQGKTLNMLVCESARGVTKAENEVEKLKQQLKDATEDCNILRKEHDKLVAEFQKMQKLAVTRSTKMTEEEQRLRDLKEKITDRTSRQRSCKHEQRIFFVQATEAVEEEMRRLDHVDVPHDATGNQPKSAPGSGPASGPEVGPDSGLGTIASSMSHAVPARDAPGGGGAGPAGTSCYDTESDSSRKRRKLDRKHDDSSDEENEWQL
eukprot:m.114108 g.114108  ORF g.114108 m.114108 type:complete len:669 (-) comp10829_c0_seq3:142-2148(-)